MVLIDHTGGTIQLIVTDAKLPFTHYESTTALLVSNSANEPSQCNQLLEMCLADQ